MFTVDASVHINALNPVEDGSSESQLFLERISRRPWPVVSPILLLVEVAAAVARVFDDAELGVAMSRVIRGLPGQMWVPLDDALAGEAVRLASQYRVRGADAVYAAIAWRYEATLVTRDRQQLERLHSTLSVMTPVQALARLGMEEGQSREVE